MNKPTHGTPIGWRTKSKAVCGRCAAITHNRTERANQMLCHFKGERALIAFRLTSLNQPRSFISQTWQSRKVSAYILKCMALFLHALGRLVVSVCMFVSASGEEGREHNAPISFWVENCLWGDGAVFGPSKLKALLEDITLCMFLVEDKYISPSCSIIRADFDNQNVWVCRISGGLYILPIHEILLPFLEHAFLFFIPACQPPCNILCNSYIQEYKLSIGPVRFCSFLFTFLFEINWTNFLCFIFVEENVWPRAIGGTTWSESLSKLPKTSLNWSRWRAGAWTVVTKWSTITKYFHQYLSKSFQLLLTGSEDSQCCHLNNLNSKIFTPHISPNIS